MSRLARLFGSPSIRSRMKPVIGFLEVEGKAFIREMKAVVGDLAQVTRLSQVDQEFAVVKVVERGNAL